MVLENGYKNEGFLSIGAPHLVLICCDLEGQMIARRHGVRLNINGFCSSGPGLASQVDQECKSVLRFWAEVSISLPPLHEILFLGAVSIERSNALIQDII